MTDKTVAIKTIPMGIRARWDQLPQRGFHTPDYITDTDNALVALQQAREEVLRLDLEYRRSAAKMYAELKKNWTKHELDKAGFWTP
jgi:hypothetical protein